MHFSHLKIFSINITFKLLFIAPSYLKTYWLKTIIHTNLYQTFIPKIFLYSKRRKNSLLEQSFVKVCKQHSAKEAKNKTIGSQWRDDSEINNIDFEMFVKACFFFVYIRNNFNEMESTNGKLWLLLSLIFFY